MRIGWRGALGIVLSVALLAYVFTKIDWRLAMEHIRHANVALLALSAITATAIFPLRARRWRTILDPVAPGVPFRKLWHGTAIGMMVNNIVPARAGELARAYVLAREEPRVPFSTAFASLAVDRLFDALVVMGFLFIAMAAPSFPVGTLSGNSAIGHVATAGVAFVVVALVGLYVFAFFPAQIISLFELFARRVAPRFEERGREILKSFAGGLGVLRSPARFLAVLWWAVLHWLCNALAFWLGFKAVGVPAPFMAAMFLQGVTAIGVAVPSSPGFFGPFELASQLGLAAYHVDPSLAATWAISYHVLSFIPITLLGAVYFVRMGLTLDEISSAGRDDRGRAEEPAA